MPHISLHPQAPNFGVGYLVNGMNGQLVCVQ